MYKTAQLLQIAKRLLHFTNIHITFSPFLDSFLAIMETNLRIRARKKGINM